MDPNLDTVADSQWFEKYLDQVRLHVMDEIQQNARVMDPAMDMNCMAENNKPFLIDELKKVETLIEENKALPQELAKAQESTDGHNRQEIDELKKEAEALMEGHKAYQEELAKTQRFEDKSKSQVRGEELKREAIDELEKDIEMEESHVVEQQLTRTPESEGELNTPAIGELKKEIETLIEEKTALQKQLAMIKSWYELGNGAIEELEEEIGTLREENKALQQQLPGTQAKTPAKDVPNSQAIEELEKKIETLTEENKNLQQYLTEIQEFEDERIDEAIEEIQKEADDLRKANNNYKEQLAKAKDVETKYKSLLRDQSLIREANEELEKEAEILMQENYTLKQQLAKTPECEDEVNRQVIGELKKEVGILMEKNKGLLQQLSRTQANTQPDDEELNSRDIEELEEEVEALTDEIEGLQQELGEAQKSKDEFDRKLCDINSLEHEVKSLTEQNEALHEQLANTQESEDKFKSQLKEELTTQVNENKFLQEQLAKIRQSEEGFKGQLEACKTLYNSLFLERDNVAMQLISCQSRLFQVLSEKESLITEKSEGDSVIEITHMLRMLLATKSITPAQVSRQLMYLNTEKFVRNISSERLDAFTNSMIDREASSGDTVVDSQAEEIKNLKKAVEFYKKNSVSSYQMRRTFKRIVRLLDSVPTSTTPLGMPSNSAQASSSLGGETSSASTRGVASKYIEHLANTVSDLDLAASKAWTTWHTYGDDERAMRIRMQHLAKLLDKYKTKQQVMLESFVQSKSA
ncbi:hypothetical protein TRVA0_031S00584 [Trichomonascus vanleenenianus]|uniref:uncharacterized protein n=1 Tax=Trichomonascus vanleenenianus TaxID=2268995 RepID=UPI003ECB2F10